MKKEKVYFILTTIFTVLTLAVVGYILAKEGKVNAGYSIIPCLFSMIFSQLYVKEKTKTRKLPKKQMEKHKKITTIMFILLIIFLILNIVSFIILK